MSNTPQSTNRLSAEKKHISNLRSQSFEDAYTVHDVGTGEFRERLPEYNLRVVNHGDDLRDVEEVYSGTGIDLQIMHKETVCGYDEVKTKQSRNWMGRLNLEHWQEYRAFAALVDKPVFLSFFYVSDVDDAVIDDSWHVRIPPSGEDDIAEKLPFESKGHKVVEISRDHAVSWPTLIFEFFDAVEDEP